VFNFDKKLLKYFDWPLLITTIVISCFGMVTIYVATVNSSSGFFRYLKPQGAALVLGIFAIALLLFIDYEFIGKLYIPIYIITCFLLILVMLIGDEANGAKSWLVIGSFIRFQPSEIAKISIIICVGKFIDLNKEHINEPLTLIKVLVFSFFPVALILENDFGTAMVCTFIIAIMLFVAGLNWKYILSAISVVLLSMPLLWLKFDEYQQQRILVFLDPTKDPTGSGYQVLQAKTAIGSGMLFGRGLEDAKFIKYGYLPENHTDMIFSVIGEVFGFAGGMFLLFLYLVIFYRLIKLARDSKDLYGSLLNMGILAMILFHVIENVGMNMGLMPVTGIPLPFISYGGTALLSNLLGVGMALSVGMRRKNLLFD
jgi:rod shape determining protein RodA